MQAEVLVPTLGMARTEWLEHRRCGIGGSDAAAVAGLNPWKSPVEVYYEKLGEIPPVEDNERMYWGRVLEDVVAREFSERTGKRVRRRNAILQHPKHDFMIANIDREIVGEKVGLECKTVSEYGRDDWKEDKVPEQYIIQCQHYMAVTGYKGWWIAALIGGNKFVHKYIERDDVIISALIELESQFWDMVQSRTPPPMDGSDSAGNVLKLLYPESIADTSVELPSEAKELILNRDALKRQVKELEFLVADAENKLKAMLGESETGRIGDYLVTWKTVTSNRVNTKKLKEEHLDIYRECCKESSYRRFSIKRRA